MSLNTSQLSRKYCAELPSTVPMRLPRICGASAIWALRRATSLIWYEDALIVAKMARSRCALLPVATRSSAAVATSTLPSASHW